MNSSFWFDTIVWDSPFYILYQGVSGYNLKKIFLSEDVFTLTNSVDPDEMQVTI